MNVVQSHSQELPTVVIATETKGEMLVATGLGAGSGKLVFSGDGVPIWEDKTNGPERDGAGGCMTT